jgi:hypothetical protein
MDGMNAPTRGAWLRAGISRDSGPLIETDRVVWLQTGPYYADSRGFAGVTSCEDGEHVEFHHDVGTPGHDVGALGSDGVNLIETGTNPGGSTYLEVWTPLSDAGGPAGSWRIGDIQVVRVGRHVVHVDGAGRGTHIVMTKS